MIQSPKYTGYKRINPVSHPSGQFDMQANVNIVKLNVPQLKFKIPSLPREGYRTDDLDDFKAYGDDEPAGGAG